MRDGCAQQNGCGMFSCLKDEEVGGRKRVDGEIAGESRVWGGEG